MKRFYKWVIVTAIILISFGFYRNWFTMSGNHEAVSHEVDVNLTVDTNKVKADVESVKDRASELSGAISDGVTQ